MPSIIDAPQSARSFAFEQETVEEVYNLLQEIGSGQVVAIVDDPVETEQKARFRITRMKSALADTYGEDSPIVERVRGRVIVHSEETFRDMTDDDGNVVLNDDGEPRQSGNGDGSYTPAVYLKNAD